MPKFHVNSYLVVRIPIAGIEAASPVDAAKIADEIAGEAAHGFFSRDFRPGLTPEQKDALTREITGTQWAEEIIGHLVDVVGDENFNATTWVEGDLSTLGDNTERRDRLSSLGFALSRQNLAIQSPEAIVALFTKFVADSRAALGGYLVSSASEGGYWNEKEEKWFASPLLATWYFDSRMPFPASRGNDAVVVSWRDALPPSSGGSQEVV